MTIGFKTITRQLARTWIQNSKIEFIDLIIIIRIKKKFIYEFIYEIRGQTHNMNYLVHEIIMIYVRNCRWGATQPALSTQQPQLESLALSVSSCQSLYR